MDTTRSELLDIYLDITFKHLPCDRKSTLLLLDQKTQFKLCIDNRTFQKTQAMGPHCEVKSGQININWLAGTWTENLELLFTKSI